jgi:hypothetical protein
MQRKGFPFLAKLESDDRVHVGTLSRGARGTRAQLAARYRDMNHQLNKPKTRPACNPIVHMYADATPILDDATNRGSWSGGAKRSDGAGSFRKC